MGLMDLLTKCENDLGWQPTRRPGDNIYKARAITFRVMTRAMEREGHTEADVALAIAYCQRKRIPIANPLALLGMIGEARKIAAAPAARAGSLLEQQGQAVQWEAARSDEDSQQWIGRLTRSVGQGLLTTLEEWKAAGRGT